MIQPRTRLCDPVLRDVDEDGAERYDSGGDEKALARVHVGRSERFGEGVEAERDHDDVDDEENDVEEEEDDTDGGKASETKGHY